MADFRVVVEGSLLPGFHLGQVQASLAKLIGRNDTTALGLLSGRAVTVKSGVDATMGERYLSALRGIGVACHLEDGALEFDTNIEPGNAATDDWGAVSTVSSVASQTSPVTKSTEEGEEQSSGDRIRGYVFGGVLILFGLCGIWVFFYAFMGINLASPLFASNMPECSGTEVKALVSEIISEQLEKQLHGKVEGRALSQRALRALPFSIEAVRTTAQDRAAKKVTCAAVLTATFYAGAMEYDQGALDTLMTFGQRMFIRRDGNSFKSDIQYTAQRSHDGSLDVYARGVVPMVAFVALLAPKLEASSQRGAVATPSQPAGVGPVTKEIPPSDGGTARDAVTQGSPPVVGQQAIAPSLEIDSIVELREPNASEKALFSNSPAKDIAAEDYLVGTVDLDGDDVAEFVLVSRSSNYCGSGGCETVVLKRNSNTVEVFQLDTSTFFGDTGQFAVLKASKNGFRLLAEVIDGKVALGEKPGTPLYGKPLVRTIAPR